jgi:hypothetical protein
MGLRKRVGIVYVRLETKNLVRALTVQCAASPAAVCAAFAITCELGLPQVPTRALDLKCRNKPDPLALRARSTPLEEMALGQRCSSEHELGI